MCVRKEIISKSGKFHGSKKRMKTQICFTECSKKRKSLMSELKSSKGTSLLSFNEIEEELISFFNSLYQKMPGKRYMPSNLVWNTVLGFQPHKIPS